MARNMSEPVDTFSVGFAGDGGSELADARLVASALGARHHELELSLSESPISLEDLVWALDEPLADLSALGFMALSKLATEDVTVALAGQGADELFAGYSRYRRAALVDRARRMPRLLNRAASASLRAAGGRYTRFAATLDDRDLAAQYLTLRAPFLDDTLRPELVRPPLRPDNSRAQAIVAGYSDGLRAARSTRRSSSRPSSSSSTTCSTTRTASRWRTRSRSGCRSSTRTSSSSRRVSPHG